MISLVGSILPWALGFVNIGFIDILCSIVAFGARIAVIVFSVFIMNGLSHAFGHGRGYTVGLVLLNLIFMCIIGLGSSKYFPKAVFDKTD